MKNVQISLDEDTLQRVDRAAEPLGLTRSEVIRQALRQWLRQRAVERFEQEWIAALASKPADGDAADAWLPAQTWSRR
jgi:metal-responsive CopG/Arc/MetJ family transcriptional regulator